MITTSSFLQNKCKSYKSRKIRNNHILLKIKCNKPKVDNYYNNYNHPYCLYLVLKKSSPHEIININAPITSLLFLKLREIHRRKRSAQ